MPERGTLASIVYIYTRLASVPEKKGHPNMHQRIVHSQVCDESKLEGLAARVPRPPPARPDSAGTGDLGTAVCRQRMPDSDTVSRRALSLSPQIIFGTRDVFFGPRYGCDFTSSHPVCASVEVVMLP